jgi:hypothetical protein
MIFMAWAVIWVLLYALAAVAFFIFALVSFNACLGRMPYYRPTLDNMLRPNLGGVMRGRGATRESEFVREQRRS